MSHLPFAEQVLSALGNKWELIKKTPFNSMFPCLKLRWQNIFVECIDLSEINKSPIDAHYFTSSRSKDCVRIKLWSDIWENHRDIVVSRLLSYSGASIKIHGRQTTCERIDKKTADAFLKNNHLQGATSAYYKYALSCNNRIVAVATFSKSRIMNDGPVYYRSYELERYCMLKGHQVVGGLSKIIKHFIAQHHAVHLMTYADADWGVGAGYEKVGFTYAGYSQPLQFFCCHNIRYAANRIPPSVNKKDCLIAYNSGAYKYILNAS